MKVRIVATDTYELDVAGYEDAWHEKCDEDSGQEEPLDSYPPVPPEFALEKFKDDLESGSEDLSEVLESATIEVEAL